MNDSQDSSSATRRSGIRSTDQVTVAVITSLAIALIIASWLYRGGLRGRLIDIESADSASITFQLDINAAEWPEWTLLPGVGETLAKRIVRDREERGRFHSHDDLGRVAGVGAVTIERMRPYLLPPVAEPSHPEQVTAAHR